MKTLEHEIRDVMSRKKEKDLIEEVNNNFINMINDMYEEEISEEKFIQLYELYIIHLNEQNEFKVDKNYSGAQLLARSNNPVNPNPFPTSISSGTTGSNVPLPPPENPAKIYRGPELQTAPSSPSLLSRTGNILKGAKGLIKGIDAVTLAANIPTSAVSSVKDFLGIGFKGDTLKPGELPPKVSEPTGPFASTSAISSGMTNPPTVTPPVSSDVKSKNDGTSPENKIKQATQSAGNITGSNIHMNQPTTPTPATTNVSRQPEMTTPLAGGATDSRMSVPTPPKINTGSVPQPATTAQPSTSAPKSQEPPESARKQKPSTSSDSSYSGRSIGDYGKDNSWVQPAFNRG